MSEINANRNHKDRMFKRLFSDKKELLSLYNAVNDSDYDNPDDIEINTIDDFVFMGMKNDISFLFTDVLNLYEHQSTVCANIPLRGFMYFGKLYDKIYHAHKDLYTDRMIDLAMPQFVVFYNGTKDEPDRQVQRMSAAFKGKGKLEPGLECTAILLNINYGHNKELMEKCKRLKEYAILIHKIRSYIDEGLSSEEAVGRAVDDCIDENVLSDYLKAHKAEVVGMMYTEFDEEKFKERIMEIGYEDGMADGIIVGKSEGKELHLIEMICRKLQKSKTPETIADELDEELDTVKAICEAAAEFAPDYDAEKIYAKLHPDDEDENEAVA